MNKLTLTLLVILLPCVYLSGDMFAPAAHPRPTFPPQSNRSYRLAQYTDYYCDAGTWIPIGKWDFYYPSTFTSKPDSLRVSWNIQNNWLPSESYVYTRNAAGKVNERKSFNLLDGNYDLTNRAVALFDDQDRLTHYYSYDVSSSVEQPVYRSHYYYSGNSLSAIFDWEDLGGEVLFGQATNQADAQGRLITSFWQQSADSLNWVNYSYQQFSYEAADSSDGTAYMDYVYNANCEWQTDYNAHWGMLYDRIDSQPAGTDWEYSWHTTFFWNTGTNVLNNVAGDFWQGEWTPAEYYNYYYDANGNLAELIEQDFGSVWEDSYKISYVWQTFTGNDDETALAYTGLQLKVYPQPFSGAANISLQSVKNSDIEVGIYNLKGQLIRRFQAAPGQCLLWDGSDAAGTRCSNGVYLIRASQLGRSVCTKAIKIN